MQPLILIPSRFQSSRFPGKPLAKISGKPMIQHVFERLSSSQWKTCVVTDHDEVEKCVKDFGGDVLRVDDDVQSGSDRIFLAFERFFKDQEVDYIVNIQGDEPLIKKDHVQTLLDFHRKSGFDICTLFKKVNSFDEFQNSNKVKIAMNEKSGRCLYFSRSGIPYDRFETQKTWKHHLGVYSYTPSGLHSFFHAENSELEKVEGLEQLKALEMGMSIGACEVRDDLCGVDTPEDIKKVELIMGKEYESEN